MNAASASQADDVRQSTNDVREKTVAFFLGDSYTTGAGSAPSGRWSTSLAEIEGWVEKNYAIGGKGYGSYQEQVPASTDILPGIIIVSGGRNDIGGWQSDSEGLAVKITDLMVALRAMAPEARIIVINPWWDDDPAPPELEQVASAIRIATERVGGMYLNTGQPLSGHPEFVVSDGVHPNAAGQAALAVAVQNALRTLRQ